MNEGNTVFGGRVSPGNTLTVPPLPASFADIVFVPVIVIASSIAVPDSLDATFMFAGVMVKLPAFAVCLLPSVLAFAGMRTLLCKCQGTGHGAAGRQRGALPQL